MKTAPFHTNHFGLYGVYNGANKVYIRGGNISCVEADSLLAGQFKSPRSSLEEQLNMDRRKLRAANNKPLSPVESRQ